MGKYIKFFVGEKGFGLINQNVSYTKPKSRRKWQNTKSNFRDRNCNDFIETGDTTLCYAFLDMVMNLRVD
jgi:hypothetical protein